jgi:hypothetical protein
LYAREGKREREGREGHEGTREETRITESFLLRGFLRAFALLFTVCYLPFRHHAINLGDRWLTSLPS